MEHRFFVLAGYQLVEGSVQFGIGFGRERRQIQMQLFQRALAVIRAVIDVENLQPLVQQGDRGQDAVAVQAVGVKVIRLEVGGGDKAHTILEQRHQQAVQDHGVGHVGHMKFVKTDQLEAPGHLLAECVQRVLGALQLAEFAMHLAHEFMEMQARLALDRHGLEEAIHQEALAATHAAIHVDPARNWRVVEHLLELAGTLALVMGPFVGTTLQRRNGAELCRITLEAARGQLPLVDARDRSVLQRIRHQKFSVRLSTARAASLVDSLRLG